MRQLLVWVVVNYMASYTRGTLVTPLFHPPFGVTFVGAAKRVAAIQLPEAMISHFSFEATLTTGVSCQLCYLLMGGVFLADPNYAEPAIADRWALNKQIVQLGYRCKQESESFCSIVWLNLSVSQNIIPPSPQLHL